MPEELKGFKKIIADFPEDISVLDVGGWGLQGQNTTAFLKNHFDNVITINRREIDEVDIIDEYYTYEFDKKFDLVVLDLNIDANIQMDWGQDFKHTKKILKQGGSIITFVMLDGEYGGGEASEMIKKHWKDYWNTDTLTPDIIKERFPNAEEDHRRPEVYWVLI